MLDGAVIRCENAYLHSFAHERKKPDSGPVRNSTPIIRSGEKPADESQLPSPGLPDLKQTSRTMAREFQTRLSLMRPDDSIHILQSQDSGQEEGGSVT